ncbi:MAG: tetratricopeptide repeat protein [Parvibaculum sp.]|nr:tetratricopeptide repeat protein [Parvibaculum sp.]
MSAFLALAISAAGVLPVRAATNVTTDLSETGGYGRMIFNWPEVVPKYTAAISAGVLVIKFDKPFDVDVEQFLRQMPQMVALARQDADGKTLRLGLKFEYYLNVRHVENSLYVDLLPSTWSGAPPALPVDVVARIKAVAAAKAQVEAEAKKARESGIVEPNAPGPELSVRVARHDGMTRLVFDWNQPVLYSLAQQDGSATITFDRSAKVALAQIRVNPPPFLKSISAIEREGRLSVFMKIDTGVVVSDFREDLGVVLDLKPYQQEGQSVEPAATAAAVTASDPASEAGRDGAPVQETKTESSVAEEKNPVKDENAAKEEHAAEDKPLANAPKSIIPKVAEVSVEEKPKTETIVENKPAVEPVPVIPAPAAEAASPPNEEQKAVVDPAGVEPLPEAVSNGSPVLLKLSGMTTENRSEITFPWTEPTGAAVFVRSNMLWVVFDRVAVPDLTGLELKYLRGFGQPMILNVEGATAMVFPITQPDMLVDVIENGTVWRVSLAHSLASTGRSIALSRNWSSSGEGYVSADLVGATKIIKLADPQMRTNLMVATARGATQALQASRSFIEFEALKSAQGVAIVAIADDINVAAAPDAVIISRRNGLTLSAENGERARASGGMESSVSPAIMNFATWRGAGDFMHNRQALLNRVVMAAATDESAARMDYARFLIGYGLAQEALTQMAIAAKIDFKIENDPAFRALRGVANVLAHRHAQALQDLSVSSLDLDPYVAGWRGLALAELGQMDKANKDFDFAGSLIDGFDPASMEKMHLVATAAALAMNDTTSAQSHLEALPGTLSTNGAQAQSYVLRGQLLEKMKKPEEALHFYGRAIELNDREQTVRALLSKALLQNSRGKLKGEEFLAELNRLRVMWRGGELELQILMLIAEENLEMQKVVDALDAMRAAIRNFPLNDKVQAMGARMPAIFADYFIGQGSRDLTGVQALAFYYEFQDLTPIGQRGDELIRSLAERLVSIDLLEQAEVLLKYQVEQRLYGSVAKAQVAARLATVYLLDDKPKDALFILRATMQNQLPPDLREKRQMIEARALASLKQYELALDLLTEIDGDQAEELRAEVYWESESWDASGQANEAMAEAASTGLAPDIALSDDVRFKVMRSAIAYALGGNTKGLTRLRTKFGDRMKTSVDANAFAVVSDPIETSGVAFRQLASRVASVNMIEKFVDSFKDDALLGATAPVVQPPVEKSVEAVPAKTSAIN